MSDFTIVNLQDLATVTGLTENDFIAIGQGDKALTKATIQQVGTFLGITSAVNVGDKNTAPTEPSFAFADAGTYPEWGNVEIIGDLGVLIFDGTNFSKTEINFVANGVVEEGNTQAVSGGEVYGILNSFAEVGGIDIDFTLHPGSIGATTGSLNNTSVNWLRTGRIPASSNTIYTAVGLGISGSSSTAITLAQNRVACYNGITFLGFISQEEVSEIFVFTTLENTDNFVIQVDGDANVGADIENSIYWERLRIQKGEFSETYLRGEKIKGVIDTPQIQEINNNIADFNSFIIEKYEESPITYSSGAFNGNGNTEGNPFYVRTSNNNPSSLVTVIDGRRYYYTGKISDEDISGIVYRNSSFVNIGVDCNEIGDYNRRELTLPVGTQYISTCSLATHPPKVESSYKDLDVKIEPSEKYIYIDCNYMGEVSNGSSDAPYKSIQEAINDNYKGNITFIISEGDYREGFRLGNLRDGNFKIKSRVGDRVRILGSNALIGWTKSTGYENIYETNYNNNWHVGSRFGKLIFEDGNPSRPILDEERHPLQKALSYRLPFTALTEATSIMEVENNAGTFYHDIDDEKVYIHTSNSSNPNENGFSYEVIARNWFTNVPNVSTSNIINLYLENIQFYYGSGSLIFQGFTNVVRKNITAIATTSAGAFRDDTSNVIAYNDEAAFCNGDGINGHFSAFSVYQTLTDHRSMQPTAIYFDPWCHDNFDDGMSHHENHRVSVYGGLIEYNDDGGVRASNDSGYTIYNAYSRKNGLVTGAGEGFSVVNPTINENRNGCKMVLYSCFSEGNAYGYAGISDSRNILEAINCISRNNINGELYANYGTVISRNTRATNSNSEKLKVTGNGGMIDIYNDDILT